jgi:predicted DNA-binding transcriptional regulator AlpA
MDTKKDGRLLRLADVSGMTSLGKSTINLWVAEGKFPRPTALSSTIKVWRLSDIEGWIEQMFSEGKPLSRSPNNQSDSAMSPRYQAKSS